MSNLHTIHSELISHIRSILLKHQEKNSYFEHLLQLDDIAIARQLFFNFKNDGEITSGFRLTNLGINILEKLFRYYYSTISYTQSFSKILIFLDKKCTMPYYVTNTELFMFESELGSMLVMTGGNMDILLNLYD